MSHLLNLTEILIWIAGSVAIAMAGMYIFKTFFKNIDVKGESDFVTGTVTIVGTLVSVVLGLLVSNSVDQYREFETCINAESTAVAEVFTLARALPEKPRSLLQNLCIEYCELTINDEWPEMKRRERSKKVSDVYAKVNDAVMAIHPTNFEDANIQSALIHSIQEVGHSRRERLLIVTSNSLQKLLPIIILCAGLLLAMSYLYVDEKPTKIHAVLISFVAIALGANIGLIVVMSRPFDSGSCGIAPDSFELNVKTMKEYKSDP